jgi:tetratricopeptide (TPR) repeat protein
VEQAKEESVRALPTKGIKRKILDVLAVLEDGGRSDDLRVALQYRGRNWRYFITDLTDRGFVLESGDRSGEPCYKCSDAEIRESILQRMSDDDRARASAVAKRIAKAAADSASGSPVEEGAESDEALVPEPSARPPESSGTPSDAVAAPETEDTSSEDTPVSPAAELSSTTEPSSPREEAATSSAPPVKPSGKRKAAARKDRRRSRTGEESARDLLRLIADSLRRGDNDTAIRFALEGIEGDFVEDARSAVAPSCFRVRGAQAYLRNLQPSEALDLLAPIIAEDRALADNESVLAHLIAAEAHLAGGSVEKAKELLVKIRSFRGEPSPEHKLRLAMLRGALALERRDSAAAFAELRQLQETPDDPADRARLALLRGKALLWSDEGEQAITPLQEALDINRNRSLANAECEAALCLALAFHQRAQYAKSESFLDRAENLAKGLDAVRPLKEVLLARATTYADRGDADRLDAALHALRRAGAGNDPPSQLLAIRLKVLRSRVGDAIEELETLAKRSDLNDRDAARVYYELGVTYRLVGHHEEALAPLKKSQRLAAQVRDRSTIARSSIDYALAQLDRSDGGDRTSAVVAVKRALRLLEFLQTPDHVWRGYHALGRIYLSEGRHEDAFTQIGDATAILDQLLGRFRDRRGREAFLLNRFEPYRDRVVAFIASRPYDSPLDRLRTSTYEEFLEFLRKNADSDSDTGPRYNEIGRLSSSFFGLYESVPPAPLEKVEEHNEASLRVGTLVEIVSEADAGTIASSLLNEGMRTLDAQKGVIGLIDADRDDAFEYFKGRNLPGRDKSQLEPIRALVRTVASAEEEVMIDGRDRLDGPGDARAIGYPLPQSDRYRGALVLWFEKGRNPANQELDILRQIVAAAGIAIRRELRFRALRTQYHRTLRAHEEAEEEIRVLSEDVQDLNEALEELEAQRSGGSALAVQEELLDDLFDQRITYKSFMETMERDVLDEALNCYEGDVKAMARALRFSPANLRKKLIRFDLLEGNE